MSSSVKTHSLPQLLYLLSIDPDKRILPDRPSTSATLARSARSEDQLKSAGAITIEKHLLLGDKVQVTDNASVHQLQKHVLDMLTGIRRSTGDITLTALAANGELRTAIPDKVRKAHKDRVRALTDRIGTGAAALKSVVSELWWRRGSNSGAVAAANTR